MHCRSIRSIAFALLALVVSASAHAQQWSAHRVLSVGEAQGISFGGVGSIAATADGRFFVLDRMESRVLVFSPAGKLEHTFGRRGAGPGELGRVATTVLVSRGQPVVVDPSNQRINLFDADGTFVRSRTLNRMQGMPMGWVTAGDRIVSLLRPLPMPPAMLARTGGITEHTVFSYDPRSDAEPDTLLRIEMPSSTEVTMGASLKMKADLSVPGLMLAGDGTGRILVAATDTYHIRIMDAAGNTTGSLTKQVTRHRYTRAELEDIRQEADSSMNRAFSEGAAMGGRAGSIPKPEVELILPEYAPVLAGVIGGDRYVLVSQGYSANDESPPWDVFAWDGQLLGTLELPDGFSPRVMLNDLVYGVERDEYDVDSVVVYRIVVNSP